MGARTSAAQAEVLAARNALAQETERMGPATREAVDIPAKIRRAPAKSAAFAGGAAFLALGGPGRVFGRARRVIFGKPTPLPDSMLPDEIEKAVRALGPDGDAVRGAIERSFADYLDQRGSYAKRNVSRAGSEVLASTIRTAGRLATVELGRRIATGAAGDLKRPARGSTPPAPETDPEA